MIDQSPRARLNELLEQLVPNAAKRAAWLEVLDLSRQAETWRASQAERERLTPLPTCVAHSPVTLAAARERLAGMDPDSEEHHALAREISAFESLNRDSIRERQNRSAA